MGDASGLKNIKQAIRDNLDDLVDSGDLGGVVEADLRKEIQQYDFPGFPCAILLTPSVQSDYDTSHENRRTVTYDILIMQKGENISETYHIENTIDAVLNKLDSDPTLQGADNTPKVVNSFPSSSDVASINTPDGTYIVFLVSLKVIQISQYRST